MAELDVVLMSIVVGALVAAPVSMSITLWGDLSHKRELAAEMALQEPEPAPEENTPADVLWNGDKVYYTDVPAEEVEHRIRESLNMLRLERSSKKDVLNIV